MPIDKMTIYKNDILLNRSNKRENMDFKRVIFELFKFLSCSNLLEITFLAGFSPFREISIRIRVFG